MIKFKNNNDLFTFIKYFRKYFVFFEQTTDGNLYTDTISGGYKSEEEIVKEWININKSINQ